MRIIFENIGMISKADIDLSGNLTVIAGENNSGKSTVGKLLYILIKTFNRDVAEKNYRNKVYKKVNDTIENFYFDLRYNLGEYLLDEEDNTNDVSSYIRKLIALRNSLIIEFKNYMNNLSFGKVEPKAINKIKFLLDNTTREFLPNNIDEKAFDFLVSKHSQIIYDIINSKIDFKEEYMDRFNFLTSSLIRGPLPNALNGEKARIKVLEGNNLILNIVCNKSEILEFFFIDELYFKDVTLIESPIIIDYQNLIHNSYSLPEVAAIQDHVDVTELVDDSTKDLVNKLRKISLQSSGDFNIDKIIDGHVEYDASKDDFVYNTKGINFNISSAASGIKSFGIIQMLLQKNVLRDRHLLILDEPEVHLHPKWQLKFAELLTEISVKTRTKILVTSHSPYFIEGLRVYNEYYGRKFNVYVKNNYYYTLKNDYLKSDLLDVNDNLDIIFDKLASPFKELENLYAGDWLDD
jgi:predicted ATP-dependent endonuclease of OLD family